MPRTRIVGPGITLALALPLSAPLAAQMHHVDKPERVTRAVGVYEWTGDIAKPEAARLIPVSIFINSRFQDAGVYLAEPVPFALQTGDVYEIQRSGSPIGTLDLDFARDIVDKRSNADDNPLGAWYGYGRFQPPAAPPPEHKLVQHSATPAVIVGSDDDSRPHFVKRAGSEDTSATTAKNGSASGSTANTGANNPAPSDDPDRPHMNRRSSGSNSTSGSNPSSGSNSSSGTTDNAPISEGTNAQGTAQDTGDVPADDPDRPTLGHRDIPTEGKKQKKPPKESGSGVEAMPTSLNNDPDRPEIHRGKVESVTAPPQLSGVPTNLHQAVAVSDAANNPIHVFARDWDSLNEKAQVLAAMQKLADPIARQYLADNHLTPSAGSSSGPKLVTSPAATPKASTTAHSTTTTKPGASSSRPGALPSTRSGRVGSTTHTAPSAAPLSFSDVQIAGYTLSYGGLPTFIYSAALPTTNGPADGPVIHVTVIAQRLPSGELQTSLSSVTDESHLDRTPWMRLVDAVDPDDSHRASLLFELRAKNSRQFALYSLATADAQQTFITGVIE